MSVSEAQRFIVDANPCMRPRCQETTHFQNGRGAADALVDARSMVDVLVDATVAQCNASTVGGRCNCAIMDCAIDATVSRPKGHDY